MDMQSDGVERQADAIGDDDVARRASRRRMLRRSLGVAAPTVLTLASNPVTACTCVAASSFISIPTFNSRKPTGVSPCIGKTPSWWKDSSTSWPTGCPGKSTTFQSIFGSSYLGTTTGFSSSTTLLQALGASGNDQKNLAAAIVATYLNVKSGKTSETILTSTGVVNLWRVLIGTPGYYKPTVSSTIQWNSVQTMVWLNEMMA